jgi:hypothetical protein
MSSPAGVPSGFGGVGERGAVWKSSAEIVLKVDFGTVGGQA